MDSNIVDLHVENYIRSLLVEPVGLLAELEIYAKENNVPIIQPEAANFMRVLFKLLKPKVVLEIGTAIGYSASFMALEMQSGQIDTIELSDVMIAKAEETFERLKIEKPTVDVTIHKGDAKEILPYLTKTYDVIFIDAAKGHYKAFLDICLPKLKPGGVVISDNVLYKGMVATNLYLIRRKITIVKRMRAYLSYITDHSELDTTILSIGDGIAISYKKEANGA